MVDKIRIFVSHHHSPDEDIFTARLVADLEAAGADVWVDDQRITSDDFIKKINEGLAGRQWLVLVMTPESLGSEWVQAEVNAALHQTHYGRMQGVIPIVAKDCDENSIPVLWATLHRYDATASYTYAYNGILKALGLTRPSVQSVAKPTPVLTPREEAIQRRERRNELLPKKQNLERKIAESRKTPTPFHYDAKRQGWESDLAEIENLLLGDDGRWHPSAAGFVKVGGAMEDYVEVWQFPCCGAYVVTDGEPSQYRNDGCEKYWD